MHIVGVFKLDNKQSADRRTRFPSPAIMWSSITIALFVAISIPGTRQQTDQEIKDFSEVLWNYDVLYNQMPDSQYEFDMNLANGKGFQSFNEDYLQLPTYAALTALFDNYEPLVGDPEPECSVCRAEEDLLMAAIFEDSPIMTELWSFLQGFGLAADTEEGFIDEMKQYWFLHYNRGGALDSSGFERVFVGERDPDTNIVGGFNSWLQLYLEEKAGNAVIPETKDYCQPNQPKIELEWFDYNKWTSSAGLGCSPEYEMAVYTLCFLARPGSCDIVMGGHPAKIQSSAMEGVGSLTIDTAYFNCDSSTQPEPTEDPTDPDPPTDIKAFSQVLWDLDVQYNQMPESEYEFDTSLPNGKGFQYLNEDYFLLPTYAAMLALFDNYEALLGDDEPVCDVCREEEDAFLDAIFNDDSPIMMELWQFLLARGEAADTVEGFKQELKDYWFQFYERDSPRDSSGFEHVFLGERDPGDQSVGGFHNWLQLYLEEKATTLIIDEIQDFCNPNQPKMSFDWFGYDKPITSVGLGHSPEYELALMTLCFVTSPNTLCDVSMGGVDAQVQTWTMNGVSPTTVGSAYILC